MLLTIPLSGSGTGTWALRRPRPGPPRSVLVASNGEVGFSGRVSRSLPAEPLSGAESADGGRPYASVRTYTPRYHATDGPTGPSRSNSSSVPDPPGCRPRGRSSRSSIPIRSNSARKSGGTSSCWKRDWDVPLTAVEFDKARTLSVDSRQSSVVSHSPQSESAVQLIVIEVVRRSGEIAGRRSVIVLD